MTTREVINKTLDTMESERLEAVKELICAADVCTHDQIIELAGIAKSFADDKGLTLIGMMTETVNALSGCAESMEHS